MAYGKEDPSYIAKGLADLAEYLNSYIETVVKDRRRCVRCGQIATGRRMLADGSPTGPWLCVRHY